MKIDLTCPVELWQYAMPTQEDAECTFVMNNLSDKVVTSVQVALHCYNQEDELLFRQSERIQGLKAGVGERFTLVILPSQWQGVEGVDLVIEKVWFDDATIWRKGNAPLAHYLPNAIAAGRALDDLRYVAGQDAVGYPQQQEEVWVCVCGRANAPDSDRCCRCERRREAVFASYSPENVAAVIAAHESKLDEVARKAREENNLLQENREKERVAARRKKKTRRRVAGTLIVLAALAAGTVLWGIPTLKYQTAADLLSDGHFDQARAAFAELEDWKDSQTQVQECDYRKAKGQLDAGDEASLTAAEAGFIALGEYADSAEMAQEAAYRLGALYLDEGRFESAAQRFQDLGAYADSADKLKETTYRQAISMMEGGSLVAARVLLEGLGDYADAAQQARTCTDQLGDQYLSEDNFESAIAEWEKLDGEAAEKIQKAYYQMAEEALAEESYGNAGQWYQLAGDYGDAQAKANESIYRFAQELKANGDYAMAQTWFERIPDYLDSAGQAQTCVYARAEVLRQNGDYEGAIALYQQIPEYSETQGRLNECRYELAMAALEAGDQAQAESILGEIVDYEDAQKQLRSLRYELAKSDQENGQYASAADRFEALGSYKDSKTRLKQCRYALADEAIASGNNALAIELLTLLDGYKDSETMLEDLQYQQAETLLQSGDETGAVLILQKMGTKRAKEKLAEISMADAKALEDAGKLTEAIALYEAMGTADAKERIKICRYQLAVQLRDQGDLPGAARAFEALGSYEDAAQQSAACWELYYGDAPARAQEAFDAGDYLTAVMALENFERNEDVEKVFGKAALAYADELYRQDKPYEALPFYQRSPKKERERKLDRRPYLVLGQWESATGITAEFRTDGTCTIGEEIFCYRVSNFSLFTGENPEEMTVTHKLSSIDEKGMSLRDIRNGEDIIYKFTRVGTYDLPDTQLPLPEVADEP